jgi:hypothetical protein
MRAIAIEVRDPAVTDPVAQLVEAAEAKIEGNSAA